MSRILYFQLRYGREIEKLKGQTVDILCNYYIIKVVFRGENSLQVISFAYNIFVLLSDFLYLTEIYT